MKKTLQDIRQFSTEYSESYQPDIRYLSIRPYSLPDIRYPAKSLFGAFLLIKTNKIEIIIVVRNESFHEYSYKLMSRDKRTVLKENMKLNSIL